MTQFINDFDLVFKNFFDQSSRFQPVRGNKMNYPVDIYLKGDDGIVFDIAAVGLTQDDLEILAEGETLRVRHERKGADTKDYIHKGIGRRGFDFAWKISNDLDLSKTTATMKDGLLNIFLPYAFERAPKRIKIN